MDLKPRTEIILSQSHATLSHRSLDFTSQPGGYLEIEGQTYLILERKHRYQLKSGRYELYRIALYVQPSQVPIERNLLNGHWVIGDITCMYNARSEMLRCAVNPSGPCEQCKYYQLVKN